MLARAMPPEQNGPFFLGDIFSLVDIALAPFWQRFLVVGGHYRGLQFPDKEPEFRRLRVRRRRRCLWLLRHLCICHRSTHSGSWTTGDPVHVPVPSPVGQHIVWHWRMLLSTAPVAACPSPQHQHQR